jgi:hypothetical protein
MLERIARWWSRRTNVTATVPIADPPLVASDVPLWVQFPGMGPVSAMWDMGGGDKPMRAFLMHWQGLDEAARHQYLDRHRAPAAWRRWLDRLRDGRDDAREIYYRVDAPVDRLV